MRHGLSDAAKIAAGKRIGPGESEAERLLSRAKNVLMFPRLREIPKPSLPLGGAGTAVFDRWMRRLFDAGLLTEILVGHVEQLALAEDAIVALSAANRPITAKWLEIRRGALTKLEALNVDTSLIPGQGADNRFETNGFPARRRSAAAKAAG